MTTPLIPARPTTYRGIPMRSRLEASFAAQLDEDECVWVYEPRAYANEYGQYLPDFQILTFRGQGFGRPLFWEVRPTLERAYLAMTVMPIIWDSEPDAWLWIAVPGQVYFNAEPDRRTWVIAR